MEKKEIITFAIAEDEEIERIAMNQFITSTFPNVQVIWEQTDGASALDAVRDNPPDILIVDIEMPVMNGLNLCARLYEEHYNGVILIHTAYAKFSYAKRAIALDVFDYILKPLDNEELKDSLQKCIDEHRRRRESRFIHDSMENMVLDVRQYALSLLTTQSLSPQQSKLFFQNLHWLENGNLQTYVLHFTSSAAFTPAEIKQLADMNDLARRNLFITSCTYINQRHYLILIQPKETTDPGQLYTLIWLYLFLCIKACPSLRFHVNPMAKTYQEIADNCRITNFSDSRAFPSRTWARIRKKELSAIRNHLSRYLLDKDFSKAERYLNRILISGPGSESERFWELLIPLIETVSEVWPAEDLTAVIAPLFASPSGISEWIHLFFQHLTTFPLCPQDALDSLLAWMKQSFDGDVTLNHAAEKMGMDPAYFSRFFKKKHRKKFFRCPYRYPYETLSVFAYTKPRAYSGRSRPFLWLFQ